jgi:tRNA pseudouridine55 synthase
VGPYRVDQARTLDELVQDVNARGSVDVLPLAAAAAAAFPRRDLTDAEATAVGHGARLPATGMGERPVAAFAPDGSLVALLTDADGQARSLAVFTADLAADPVSGS